MKTKVIFITGLNSKDDFSSYFPPLTIKPDVTINTSALKCDARAFKAEVERHVDENTIVVCHSFGVFPLLHSYSVKHKMVFLLDPSTDYLGEKGFKEKVPEPFKSQMKYKDSYKAGLCLFSLKIYRSKELNTNHAFEDKEVCEMISNEIRKYE